MRLPIKYVDGAFNLIKLIHNRLELFEVLREIEEFYGHPEDLDGEQDSEGGDYGGEYFERWMQKFTDWHIGHAKNLLNRTGCKTALDAGCGMGNIVKGLLRVGVDAWGFDISRYVVENCDPEIRGRILWGDLSKAETLPNRQYDLVIGYDLVEHAPDPEASIRNLCNLSSKWIHVKAPDIRGLDKEESARFDSTHITGRSIKWWIDHFDMNGFNLVFDEGYSILKWDQEYALAPTGAPDLHGLFKRKVVYK